MRLTLYDYLELSDKATPEEIEETYKELVKIWHAHKVEKWAPEEELETCDAMFERIQNAYLILNDPAARAAYDERQSVLNKSPLTPEQMAVNNAYVEKRQQLKALYQHYMQTKAQPQTKISRLKDRLQALKNENAVLKEKLQALEKANAQLQQALEKQAVLHEAEKQSDRILKRRTKALDTAIPLKKAKGPSFFSSINTPTPSQAEDSVEKFDITERVI